GAVRADQPGRGEGARGIAGDPGELLRLDEADVRGGARRLRGRAPGRAGPSAAARIVPDARPPALVEVPDPDGVGADDGRVHAEVGGRRQDDAHPVVAPTDRRHGVIRPLTAGRDVRPDPATTGLRIRRDAVLVAEVQVLPGEHV